MTDMMNVDQMTTGQQLIDYLDTEARTHRMHAGTASSRKSAVREVLNVSFGEGWEGAPFQSIDVDALLDRFVAAHRDDFARESIQSYRSNFRRTVELALGDSQGDLTESWVSYRFPIRDGYAVEMRLPADLTTAEARRLATLITALPVDES
jgi:hypothetical protein